MSKILEIIHTQKQNFICSLQFSWLPTSTFCLVWISWIYLTQHPKPQVSTFVRTVSAGSIIEVNTQYPRLLQANMQFLVTTTFLYHPSTTFSLFIILQLKVPLEAMYCCYEQFFLFMALHSDVAYRCICMNPELCRLLNLLQSWHTAYSQHNPDEQHHLHYIRECTV
jgi:hypothetical protein